MAYHFSDMLGHSASLTLVVPFMAIKAEALSRRLRCIFRLVNRVSTIENAGTLCPRYAFPKWDTMSFLPPK